MMLQTRVTRFPQGRWVCKSSQLQPRLLSGLFLAAVGGSTTAALPTKQGMKRMVAHTVTVEPVSVGAIPC
jgi:hypothetical protein